MIDQNNKAICPAPWVSLFVEPTGRVDNCCVGKNNLGNVQKNNVKEIVIGNINQSIQQSMLNGIYPAGCSWCEKGSNIRSLQQRIFDIFPDRSEENYQLGTFKLQYLDARWNNTCNLACVYCTPEYSSTWAQELNKPVRIEKQYKKELLEYVIDNVENLKEVYLAGGEPLLMKENELLISALKEKNPGCHVLINTNLTQIKNNSIFENLVSLKNSNWLVSVDDSQERFEYLRYPARWNEFTDNLQLLKSQTNINNISFNMVLTSLNALTIWDTVDWLLDQGFQANGCVIQLFNNGLSNHPFDVRSLPVEYQRQTMIRMNQEKYKKTTNWESVYEYLAKLVENPPSLALKKYLLEFDNRRGLDSKVTFPLVYEYL
jgi:MoaA/NifB/PqqE/SkfB family radical SAM enzyme